MKLFQISNNLSAIAQNHGEVGEQQFEVLDTKYPAEVRCEVFKARIADLKLISG
jgi:hypothetical protein